MSENTVLEPVLLEPATRDLFVMFDGLFTHTSQVEAVGTKEQLRSVYQNKVETNWLMPIKDFVRLHSQKICEQQRENQERSKNHDAYVQSLKELFPVGSIVTLKSGGPKMTVESIDDWSNEPKINTIFYLDNREITKQKFVPDVLKLVPDKKEESTVAVS